MSVEEQFEALYREARQDVYHYMLTFRMDAASAQDATQEAFARLYSAWRGDSEIRNPRAWVFRTAHNLGVNARKQSGRLEPAAEDRIAGSERNPEQRVLSRERAARIAEALAELSTQQRQCLHLRAEGLKYREIAEATGTQISTVSTFVTRAINRIRKAIDD